MVETDHFSIFKNNEAAIVRDCDGVATDEPALTFCPLNSFDHTSVPSAVNFNKGVNVRDHEKPPSESKRTMTAAAICQNLH